MLLRTQMQSDRLCWLSGVILHGLCLGLIQELLIVVVGTESLDHHQPFIHREAVSLCLAYTPSTIKHIAFM